MMMRPARAMMRDEAGRGSSMPYISAFSREGAALMTLGTTTSPSETAEAEAWRSRRAARRRGVGMEEAVGEALLESVLRFLAIRGRGRASAPVQVPYRQEPSRQARRPLAAAAVALAFVRAVLGGRLGQRVRRRRRSWHRLVLGHAGLNDLGDWRFWAPADCAGGLAVRQKVVLMVRSDRS
jgi:hypothetical protein